MCECVCLGVSKYICNSVFVCVCACVRACECACMRMCVSVRENTVWLFFVPHECLCVAQRGALDIPI